MTQKNEKDRDAKGRFGKGNAGKPRGARHQTTLAVEDLMDGQAEALTQKVIDAALAGDMAALRLCLERIAPARRGRIITIKRFPSIKSASDVPTALSTLLAAVARGELTADEADAIASLCSRYVTALEVGEYDARLRALEEMRK